MIYLYTGTPGSGKSYHMIEQVFAYLKRRKHVITNFPLRFTNGHIRSGYPERHVFLRNDDITIDFLINYSVNNNINKSESNCLLCIDEAGIKFNSRNFSNADRMKWIEFFSQHRKFGYDVILVAQMDRMIDRQIRNLAEYEVKHRKINNYGILRFIPFTCFVYVTYWYSVKQKVSSETSIFLKFIADRYDTMALFSSSSSSSK